MHTLILEYREQKWLHNLLTPACPCAFAFQRRLVCIHLLNLHPEHTWNLGQSLGQLRATPVRTAGGEAPDALLLAYCADFDLDPYIEMFFFPSDTLHLALVGLDGKVRWKVDLGPGAIPGMWFSPFFAMDLDGDGFESIYTVLSADPQHPLSQNQRVVRKLSPHDGSVLAEYPWINRMRVDLGAQWMGMQFRDFVFGGRVGGEPVFVTAQGTYGDMYLRGFGPGMVERWDHFISADSLGARGSHMCSVLDWNGDGDDELLWGERLISLRDGRELWCADREVYQGHSDIIQPVRMADGRFNLFTARESDPDATPRVAVFDDQGQRRFGGVDAGHMDMGWVARAGPGNEPLGMAVRIGRKTCGPDGRFHANPEIFSWDLTSGEPLTLPFPAYGTLPVDLDGDGKHEFLYGIPGQDGRLVNADGEALGTIPGCAALLQHIGPWPGEQVLSFTPEGDVTLWRDLDAVDHENAHVRYDHPAYKNLTRFGATGWNLAILGGI